MSKHSITHGPRCLCHVNGCLGQVLSPLAGRGRHLTPLNMPVFNGKNARFSTVLSKKLGMLENAAQPMGRDAPATSAGTWGNLWAHLMALGGT